MPAFCFFTQIFVIFFFLKNTNPKGVSMLTFIAFVLMITGGINWLLIGLLQYDFIAGLFGFQASMFSRLIYIIFGSSTAFVALRTLLNKGTVKLFERRKKKSSKTSQTLENNNQMPAEAQQPAHDAQNLANFQPFETENQNHNSLPKQDNDRL